MSRLLSPLSLVALLALAAPAYADPPPPENAKPLSEILRMVEAEPDFRYVDEVEWDDGRYEIEYVTRQGAKRTIHVDPVTGQRR